MPNIQKLRFIIRKGTNNATSIWMTTRKPLCSIYKGSVIPLSKKKMTVKLTMTKIPDDMTSEIVSIAAFPVIRPEGVTHQAYTTAMALFLIKYLCVRSIKHAKGGQKSS
jgi:hypothetical protein